MSVVKHVHKPQDIWRNRHDIIVSPCGENLFS